MNCAIHTVRWRPPSQRRLFRLGPFRVSGLGVEDVLAGGARRLAKGGLSQWVLVALFDERARLERCHGSPEKAGRRAVSLSKATGDPVVIGRQVGLAADGLPVFESIGVVLTEKANALTPAAFEAWVRGLSRKILEISRDDLNTMATQALSHLDLDFRGVSPNELDRALLGYRSALSSPSQTMLRVQQTEISQTMQRVLRSAGLEAQRLPQVRQALGTGFTINDREVSRLLAKNHSFWVRDRYGAISDSMSSQARAIISSGVQRGLGPNEIAGELKRMTGRGVRQEHYYRTVAANQVARARSYSTGATYRAAGIEYYRIEAVLDDRTTHQCEFLHGKVLPVGPGIGNIERTLNDPNPQAVLANQPFIIDRGSRLTIPTPGGGERTVARIDQRSTGAAASGPTAVFSRGMSSSDLVSAAVGFPPYHHNCRTTTVPA